MLSLLHIFGLHAAVLGAAWLLFGRRLALPFALTAAVWVVYLTVPLFVAVKGVSSAVYLSDIVLPLLLIYLASKRAEPGPKPEGFAALAVLLFALPLTAGALGGLARGTTELGGRDLMEIGIWYYRNVVLIATFYFAARLRLTTGEFHEFAKLVVLFGGASAALGMVNYFGPLDLAVFEELLAKFNPEFAAEISASKIGAGFLGLFRASIGQWYATVVLLALATSGAFNLRWKLISYATVALGTGAILLSYSRAGVVGLLFGLMVLGMFSARGGQRLAVLAAAVVGVVWLALAPQLFEARLQSIVSHEDTASAGRMEAWQRSLRVFADEPLIAITGLGATNQEEVFEAIGAHGAHNEYIDVVFRMGAIGPLVLIWALGSFARRFWKQRTGADRSVAALGAAGLAVLAANVVMGLTQENLIRTYAGYTCGLMLYLLYGALVGVGARGAQLVAHGPPVHPGQPVLKLTNLMT